MRAAAGRAIAGDALVSRRSLVLVLLAVVLAAAAAAVVLDRTVFSRTAAPCVPRVTRSARPALQRILDGAVRGKLAPGATAYVSGPHGTWSGASGVADTGTCEPMPVDARMRLESVSKIYTAALVVQLAEQGRLRLDDTVETWLPGLLRAHGDRITIRQLLTMTSGLVDNNDFNGSWESFERTYLVRVGDEKLREQVRDFLGRGNREPSSVLPELTWIKLAAWQPLLFEPGGGHHYSNIGYDVLGLIAARAGGRPLPALYRERIFEPLGLHATAYDPQGPIAGPHARGYGIDEDGGQTDATDHHWGVGAEGGVVSNARETGAFLAALMSGKVVGRKQVEAMEGDALWRGGAFSGCAGTAYGWSGGGAGYKTDVWVEDGGRRVAVVLFNARHYGTAQAAADQRAHDTLARLFCAA